MLYNYVAYNMGVCIYNVELKMTWQETYKKEQEKRFTNSTFSRVRGKTIEPIYIVIWKKGLAKSNIFKIHSVCGGLLIKGICQKCEKIRICSWCQGVIQADGKAIKMPHPEREITHGICKSCRLDALNN